MSSVWTEDQTELLDYSLRNILTTIKDNELFASKYFYIATPFSKGYRFFDIEGDSLEEMVFKATEMLQSKNIDRLNLETADGLPILTIYLEEGPTVIIDDVVTGKSICNIAL